MREGAATPRGGTSTFTLRGTDYLKCKAFSPPCGPRPQILSGQNGRVPLPEETKNRVRSARATEEVHGMASAQLSSPFLLSVKNEIQ